MPVFMYAVPCEIGAVAALQVYAHRAPRGDSEALLHRIEPIPDVNVEPGQGTGADNKEASREESDEALDFLHCSTSLSLDDNLLNSSILGAT
jgi:hypothetical protein